MKLLTIKLDKRQSLSLEEQFVIGFSNALNDSLLTAESFLPSPFEMAKTYSLRKEFVEELYQKYISEGKIEFTQQRFIKSRKMQTRLNTNHNYSSLSEIANDLGLKLSFEVKSISKISAFDILKSLNFNLTETYLKMERLNFFNDAKGAWLTLYIQDSLIDTDQDYLSHPFKLSNRLDEILSDNGYQTHRYMSIIKPNKAIQSALDIHEDNPVLMHYSYIVNENQEVMVAIEFSTHHEAFFAFESNPYPNE